MNWKLIFLLTGFGVIMGVGTIYGATGSAEPILWLIIGAYCAYMIVRWAYYRIFLHGLLVGLFMGLAHFIIQMAFYSVYEAHNPPSLEFARQYGSILERREFMMYAGLVIMAVIGLVQGLLAIAANKLFGSVIHRSRTKFRRP